MRTFITLLITVSISIWSHGSLAEAQKNNQEHFPENIQSDIRQLKQDVKITSSDIEILRRDQVNYRIEKDILKEAYSSNLQAINMAITIALGVIGLLGYLGIRSIKEVKSDYTSELDELKKLKVGFEMELQSLVDKQKEFENKIGDLAVTNEKQDRRLKVLELTEKVAELMKGKQWQWALQYIPLGLEIDKDNVPLLSQKSICHGKLGELSSEIESCKKIIGVAPENIVAKANLLEYLALSGQKNQFELTYAAYKNEIDQYEDSNVIDYLNILLYLITGDLKAAVVGLDAFAKKFPGGARKHLGTWSFDEVLNLALKLPAGKQKELLVSAAQYFDGKISSDDFLTYLATQ